MTRTLVVLSARRDDQPRNFRGLAQRREDCARAGNPRRMIHPRPTHYNLFTVYSYECLAVGNALESNA